MVGKALLLLVLLLPMQVQNHRKIFSGGGGGVANDVNCAVSDASGSTNCSITPTATDEVVVFVLYRPSASSANPTSTGITFTNRWRNADAAGNSLGMWTAPSVSAAAHTITFSDPGVNRVLMAVYAFSNFTAVDSTAAQEFVNDQFGNLTFNNMTGLTGSADVCIGAAFENSFNPLTSISWGSGYAALPGGTAASGGVASGIKTGVSTSSQPSVTMTGFGNGAEGEFCVR